METVNCNLCDSPDSRLLYNLTDLLLDRKEVKATLVECLHCGLVYQNPRPTFEEMNAHYPPEYDTYNPEIDQERTSWLSKQAVQYGNRKRSRFITRHKQGGRLLDVGCATGIFMRGMQEYPGWELHGVEISRDAALIAREKYGLNVMVGTLEEAKFPEDYFDAVTLWDVLEHLHDPFASLCEIHRILKPNGILVLRVPNRDSWEARLFGPYWPGLDAPRHLYLFDRHTLTAMLERAGFEVYEMNCRSGVYPTFVLSIRFWLVAKGVNRSFQRTVLKTLNHPIMRVLASPFFFLGGLGLIGPHLNVTSFKGIVQTRRGMDHEKSKP